MRDAEALLLKRKAAVREGKQPEIKRIRNYGFYDLVLEYTKWAERQKSFKRSKVYLIKKLFENFGNLPLRCFNTMVIEQFQTEKIKKGNKPATVNRFTATLSHMFTKAVEWYMVENEVLKRIRKVKMLKENNRRLRYLSVEEIQRLINSCDNHLRPIVIVALNTGMRKDEILNLKWDNLDLRAGFILLTQDMTKNGERKEIPINRTLNKVFEGIQRHESISYVFYNPLTSKRYDDIKRSFTTALKKAEIKDFHFHDLRHTFASHLVMSGIDLTTVKELLGHKDFKMTLRYAHLSPSHKVKAVDILDKVLNEK